MAYFENGKISVKLVGLDEAFTMQGSMTIDSVGGVVTITPDGPIPITIVDPIATTATVTLASLPEPIDIAGTLTIDEITNVVTITHSGSLTIAAITAPVTIAEITQDVDIRELPIALTPTQATVTVTTSSTNVLPADANREYLLLTHSNGGSAPIYIHFGDDAATTTNAGFVLYEGQYFAPPDKFIFRQAVKAITTGASKTLHALSGSL